MSKEWTHDKLTCRSCGAVGKLSMWSDDQNRWGSELHGFSGRVYVLGAVNGALKCDACGGADIQHKLEANSN